MYLPKSMQSLAPNSANNAVISRRVFVLSASLVAGALVIGCSRKPSAAKVEVPTAIPVSPFESYVAIAPDGTVTVYSSQFEMGQGAYQGLATLVADELGVSLERVRVEGRAGNPVLYGNVAMGGSFQLTGGSSSMAGSWQRYRRAGAAAREMLIAAAAKRWQLAPASLSVRDGVVVSGALSVPYGELLADAALVDVPSNIVLKGAQDYTLIGQDSRFRLDSVAMTTGAQQYTIDLALPGMLVATVLHSPRFGGKLKSFDATAAKAIPGVAAVLQISSGVAVVASNTWAAIQGRIAVQAVWDDALSETRSSAEIMDAFTVLSAGVGKPAKQRGDAKKALGKASKTIEAIYRFPYLAHAAMEPLNALIHKDGDTLHVYGGLQMPDAVQAACAQIAGVKPEHVTLHVMKTGGGFGRRATADCDVFVQACEIAKAMNFSAPIKLQWTREADMSYGRYRPLHVHRVSVGLDKKGAISGWQHHIVGQSILVGTPFESFMVDGIDNASHEGVSDTEYLIPDFDLQVTHPSAPISVLWWRSVGHTHTAFVMETMLDEIAQATQQDPLALRLKLLPKTARQRAVLELVAAKAGWAKPLAPGRFRGIAVHQSFGSFVATVAEVSKAEGGAIKVERCVVASDCGTVINPDIVRAQIEGGTGFGLGSILSEQVQIEKGAALAQNYDSYQCLRIDAMPEIEVHLLPSSAPPTGIGECAVPPIGPAVANAIFQATGQRLRDLPFLKV
jgi:isoquinoline 1-oxidoreductase subunit beta